MKIIILAAGKGERLFPLTRNTPKPLLDLGNGNTLLEEQILRIQKSEAIEEIVLVIGYLADQIEAKIKMHTGNGIKIKTIYNPFFEQSNNLISLWLAKSEMYGDFMITNGDNIFNPEVFYGLSQNKNGVYLSINYKDKYDDDDMKVTLADGTISRVNKKINGNDIHAESPGLALISGQRSEKIFIENLEEMIKDKENINNFWLEAFNNLHQKGVSIYPWEFEGKSQWQEVDFHLDLDKARELISLKLN